MWVLMTVTWLRFLIKWLYLRYVFLEAPQPHLSMCSMLLWSCAHEVKVEDEDGRRWEDCPILNRAPNQMKCDAVIGNDPLRRSATFSALEGAVPLLLPRQPFDVDGYVWSGKFDLITCGQSAWKRSDSSHRCSYFFDQAEADPSSMALI